MMNTQRRQVRPFCVTLAASHLLVLIFLPSTADAQGNRLQLCAAWKIDDDASKAIERIRPDDSTDESPISGFIRLEPDPPRDDYLVFDEAGNLFSATKLEGNDIQANHLGNWSLISERVPDPRSLTLRFDVHLPKEPAPTSIPFTAILIHDGDTLLLIDRPPADDSDPTFVYDGLIVLTKVQDAEMLDELMAVVERTDKQEIDIEFDR